MKLSLWHRWWKSLFHAKPSRPICRAGTHRRTRPRLEQLEDRTLLSGTPQMVLGINTTPLSSNPSGLVTIGSTTYFSADDGVHGRELWKTDGTAAGTVMVKNIAAGDPGSNPSDLTNINGTLFYEATGGLWKSDGTAAGTTLVRGSGTLYDLTNVNGTLFFATQGNQLWKSDGTTAGTVRLAGFDSNPHSLSGFSIYNPTNVNGTLFFSAYTITDGQELWKSDGTAAGTTEVKDIYPGSYRGSYSEYPNSSNPSNLTNVNGTLFFSANDGTDGNKLWKSDGTAAGTVLVAPGS